MVIGGFVNCDSKERKTISRTVSFKKSDENYVREYERLDKVVIEEKEIRISKSSKRRKVGSIKLPTRVLFTNEVLDEDSSDMEENGNDSTTELCPRVSLISPEIQLSSMTNSELNAAAIKLQKFYKSHRTRRNLADCAVVVEELWWKALDFAALKQSSISFFQSDKSETAVSRWARARTRAAKVGKGLSKNEKAKKLSLSHWLEAIDPRHRYGHNLHLYYEVWFHSESSQPFFYWLDIGDGKEVNLENCPRTNLQRQCIIYLRPKEREAYEVIAESGKLVYRKSGVPLDTDSGTKWIFVLSTTRNFYVGEKKKGLFQHSSFLSGGATTAAGRLVAHNGVLEAIWPYSGHYHPTEENFVEFISFLEENHVNLNNVKRYAIDDDDPSSGVPNEELKSQPMRGSSTDIQTSNMESTEAIMLDKEAENSTTVHEDSSTGANVKAPTFQLANRWSSKWTSGTGPRIGCVREYPPKLQFQALEHVNLSPRTAPAQFPSSAPIPSPRPSPKVHLSPALAYMGLPSPRLLPSLTPKVSTGN